MNIARIVRNSAGILLLFCSCATPDFSRRDLPAEVSFNQGAGRGDFLFVALRLKNGDELLFAVDTGFPFTVLDKSLESKLGKCVFTNQIHYAWYPTSEGHVYGAPELFLGNTRLITGNRVHTDDLGRMFPSRDNASRRVLGILGMDCLQHYCIQLNFMDGKMRFLDPNHLATDVLGKAYPLTISTRAPKDRPYIGQSLAGVKGTKSWIDTGDPNDGYLVPELFEQELQNQPGTVTKQIKTPAGTPINVAKFPDGAFDGETYTNLNVQEDPGGNVIGLRFLARHLVTFNFPKRMMYLKRERAGPLDLDSGNR